MGLPEGQPEWEREDVSVADAVAVAVSEALGLWDPVPEWENVAVGAKVAVAVREGLQESEGRAEQLGVREGPEGVRVQDSDAEAEAVGEGLGEWRAVELALREKLGVTVMERRAEQVREGLPGDGVRQSVCVAEQVWLRDLEKVRVGWSVAEVESVGEGLTVQDRAAEGLGVLLPDPDRVSVEVRLRVRVPITERVAEAERDGSEKDGDDVAEGDRDFGDAETVLVQLQEQLPVVE